MIQPIRCKCGQRLGEFEDETGNVAIDFRHPAVIVIRSVILLCPREDCRKTTRFDGDRQRKKKVIQRFEMEVKVYKRIK